MIGQIMKMRDQETNIYVYIKVNLKLYRNV